MHPKVQEGSSRGGPHKYGPSPSPTASWGEASIYSQELTQAELQAREFCQAHHATPSPSPILQSPEAPVPQGASSTRPATPVVTTRGFISHSPQAPLRLPHLLALMNLWFLCLLPLRRGRQGVPSHIPRHLYRADPAGGCCHRRPPFPLKGCLLKRRHPQFCPRPSLP